jgi:hypothetical protein
MGHQMKADFFASEKQGKSHKWWAKKFEISTTMHALENHTLVREKFVFVLSSIKFSHVENPLSLFRKDSGLSLLSQMI